MHWIDIVWPMLGAASLTLALVHLLGWLRDRSQRAPLMFGLAAGSVAVLSIFELLLMRAQTPQAYAILLRWAHVPVALLACALVGFVLLHFRAGRPWLGLAGCALRAGALVANFLTGANLNFRTVGALERVDVRGGESIAVPVGVPNPWMLLGVLSNLLIVLFLIDAIVSVWRRGEAEQRRRVLLVCGSIAVFLLVSNLWTGAVVLHRVQGPLTINVTFLVVILVMSFELGGEVLRAAQRVRQLAESESRLRESEQRVQLAAQAAGLGFWTQHLDSGDSWFADTSNKLLGVAPGEQIRRDTLLSRIHPDDHGVFEEARNAAIQGGGDYACEFRLMHPDGRMRWIAARGRVESAPSGAARCIRGVLLDVTERRQAEERFRAVIDSAATAMLMVDRHGRITLANAEAERVFGYGRSELLGASIDMLVPEGARAGHAAFRSAFSRDPQARAMGPSRALCGRRKDGSEVRVEIGLTPITIADDLFVLASVTDISARLRLEQESALQRDELAHLSRVNLLGEMSGSLAHELNQPLTAVLSNAQAALRFLQHEHPDLGEVRDSLTHIVENDKRASEVIRRLRALLRKEQVDYQLLSINEVVRDVLRLINSDLLNRSVAVSLDLAKGLPAVSGDRVQLQQVLLNLVINACDAMEQVATGRVLAVRTQAAPGSGVEVSISDVGRGIPEDQLEGIFAPFNTSKAEGIGLGLAICRTIVAAHRGTLWATNNPSRGATLHFVLPADATAADAPEAPGDDDQAPRNGPQSSG